MAGQSIAAASSQAWAAMGSQAEYALNRGFIADQTIGAGPSFATAAAPSSQTQFTSSGDGTTGSGNGYFAIGRRLEVVGSSGTAYPKVSAASYAAPVTTVTVTDFLSPGTTALSTGGITSVSAGPMVPLAYGTAAKLAVGSSAPSSGLINFEYSTDAIVSMTTAGTADRVWPMQYYSTSLAADVASTAATGWTVVLSKSLGPGPWLIDCGITIGPIPARTVQSRIDDGTNVYASAGSDSTSPGVSQLSHHLTAVVSHTSALTYNLSFNPGSTSAFARTDSTGAAGASTGATYLRAWKIG